MCIFDERQCLELIYSESSPQAMLESIIKTIQQPNCANSLSGDGWIERQTDGEKRNVTHAENNSCGFTVWESKWYWYPIIDINSDDIGSGSSNLFQQKELFYTPSPRDAYFHFPQYHYSDVIMIVMTSQMTGVSIVYSTVCSGADKKKYQRSALLAFVRWPVNSAHKGLVTRKMFPFDDVIMH